MVHFKRHLAKTITYRILGTITTTLITFYFTGNWIVSGSVGAVELIIKPLNYFLHERIWYKYIKYGVIKDESNTILVGQAVDRSGDGRRKSCKSNCRGCCNRT